jgi:hypothetical protein
MKYQKVPGRNSKRKLQKNVIGNILLKHVFTSLSLS